MAPQKKSKLPEKPNRKVTDFFQRSDPPSSSRSVRRALPSEHAVDKRGFSPAGVPHARPSSPLGNRRAENAVSSLPPSSPPAQLDSPAPTVISLSSSTSANPDNSIISLSSGPASMDVSIISLSSSVPSTCHSVVDLCSGTSHTSSPRGVDNAADISFTSTTCSAGLDDSLPEPSGPSSYRSPPLPNPVSQPLTATPSSTRRLKRFFFSHVEIVTPSKTQEGARHDRSSTSARPPQSPLRSARPAAQRHSLVPTNTGAASESNPTRPSFKRKIKEVADDDGEVRDSAPIDASQSNAAVAHVPASAFATPPLSSPSDRPLKKLRLTPEECSPLPSSQSGENSKLLDMDSSPAKSANDLGVDQHTGGEWDNWEKADNDWNMDAHVEGRSPPVTSAVPFTPPSSRLRHSADASSTALDEAEVSQELVPTDVASPPTAPTTALPTPASPQTAKSIIILEDIKEKAKREIAEDERKLLVLREADSGSDSDGLIDDPLMHAARPERSPSEAPSSPLTELSEESDAGSSRDPRPRRRSSSSSPSLGPARRAARIYADRSRSPETNSFAAENTSASGEGQVNRKSVPHAAPRRNEFLDSLTGKNARDRSRGVQETMKTTNEVVDEPRDTKRNKAGMTAYSKARKASKKRNVARITPHGSPDLVPSTPSSSRLSSSFNSSPSGSESEDSYSNAAVLDNLGDEGAQEIQRIFESDKLERSEKRRTAEERGRLSEQRFWLLSASGVGREWSPQTLQSDRISQLNSFLASGKAEIFAMGSIPFLQTDDVPGYESWLFDMAGHHPDVDIALIAQQCFVNHLRGACTARPGSIPLDSLLQTCCDVGVHHTASWPFSSRLTGTASIIVGDHHLHRTRIIASLACALLSMRNFPTSDLPDAILLVLLIGLDPSSTVEMKRQMKFAIEDSVQCLDPADLSVEMDVYTRISEVTFSLNLAQKCSVLELLPCCGEKTRRLHRWLANDFLLQGAGLVPDIDAYSRTPSVTPMVRAVDADSQMSVFAVHAGTDYEAVRIYTQFLESVLTDIGSYMRNDRANVELLTDVHDALTRVYGKIVDTRAAYLDRTRAKDAIQRLRMRLYWSLPRDRGEAKQQSQIRFPTKTAVGPGEAPPRGEVTGSRSGQVKARPKPRRLNP